MIRALRTPRVRIDMIDRNGSEEAVMVYHANDVQILAGPLALLIGEEERFEIPKQEWWQRIAEIPKCFTKKDDGNKETVRLSRK
ncbi:hypothetical protein P7K49_014138 [Saguinus oedipus]|uniref:Uncharacterized protein n=1 Tax=Saguinus oedipus TaxID=9490 RepID=A0ABQ9VHZ9_SAGOE|nr:hypothetical protein P7K49_014138 [Saguinus oedipus]